MSLSEKLGVLRKEKGLTQIQLAEEVDVSRQAISRWELGEAVPSTENLVKLAAIFEVPLDYLVNEDSTLQEVHERKKGNSQRQLSISVRMLVLILSIIAVLLVALIRNELAWKKAESKEPIPIEKLQKEHFDELPEPDPDFEIIWID